VGIGIPWPNLWDSIGTGIYTRTGYYSPFGGHAVVAIGWAEFEGKRYWQIENSHGPIYPPLPAEKAAEVMGYNPLAVSGFGFAGTFDFWVLEEALLEVLATKNATSTIASGLSGFKVRGLASFCEVYE
jgi:hypothetical protein